MLHGRGSRGFQRVVSAGCAVAVSAAVVFASVPVSARQAADTASASHPTGPETAVHAISVAFNYDFTKTPACSATVTTNCVAKFQVFDISLVGKQYLLFTIAVPPGATGKTNPIKASSSRMTFVIGKHRLGVSAVTPEGGRSDPALCSTIVSVGPAATK